MNDNIAQLQAQLAEVDDQYLAEQAKNAGGMNGLMAAIEMSKRNKMRAQAAAIADSYSSKDGTVLQDTLGQFQAAREPMASGYANGGAVREYGELDWRNQFNVVPPWQTLYEGYVPPEPVVKDYTPYQGLGSVGQGNLANLRDYRRRNPQSPSPDYDRPAGPDLPPSFSPDPGVAPYSPFDAFNTLPILAGERAPTPDPVAAGASDAAAIFQATRPRQSAVGAAARSAPVPAAVSQLAPSSFDAQYEKLLAGIKGDTPGELKPPRELDQIDPTRVERLNRAMALGAMAKQFATNNNFVGGFGAGAADAAAIMAAGRERLQAEQMDRAKIQSQYDIANAEQIARERLADKSAANNINLSRVETARDVELANRRFEHDKAMANIEAESRMRITQATAQIDAAQRSLEFDFRVKLAEMEDASRKGDFERKAELERELKGMEMDFRQLDADKDRALRAATSVQDAVSELTKGILASGQASSPDEAYDMARALVASGLPVAAGRPTAGSIGVRPVK